MQRAGLADPLVRLEVGDTVYQPILQRYWGRDHPLLDGFAVRRATRWFLDGQGQADLTGSRWGFGPGAVFSAGNRS